jgi:TonB family protein
MLPILALALAAAQTDPPVPEYRCPTIILAAAPARAVTLVVTDLTAWRGPVLELQIAATPEEVQSIGALRLLRLSGKIHVGGMLGRRIDDQDRYSLALSFEPEQLATLTATTALELVAEDGAILAIALTPADPAPIKSCLDANNVPAAAPGDPLTRRSYTFVPLEPNQPLRLRHRGDPGPMYPEAALREEREGSSRVAITVSASGRITECSVIVSSGHEDLDAASCRAARQSAYLPETNAAGEPVDSKREQALNWVIADKYMP